LLGETKQQQHAKLKIVAKESFVVFMIAISLLKSALSNFYDDTPLVAIIPNVPIIPVLPDVQIVQPLSFDFASRLSGQAIGSRPGGGSKFNVQS
jgi:hypothetical protein